MNKIIVKHTSIVINNYKLGDCKKLESIFSIYDLLTHTRYFKGIEYIKKENKLILPRGIDIFYIEKLFSSNAKVDYKHDPMDHVKQILIKYLPRDQIQKESLKFMLGEGIKYKYTKSKSQLSINLTTGSGKTYCSIATASYLGLRSIIITSSINWLEQWKNCICEYTDTNPREIYLISGTPSIKNLLKRDNINQYKFILASHATIKSYGDKYGWEKITELFNYLKVGLKFYDEAHLNFDNICKIDYYTNTFKTFYVTATPLRSSNDENRIYQLAFKNIPTITLFDKNKDPHTKYIAIKYKSNPSPQEISKCKNMYGLDRNKYTSYIVKKENYYKILRIILNIVLKMNGKILIYIGTNKAIKITKEWICNNYPELYNNVGVYTSIIKENKENQLDKKIILSTTKSCGAAMDIKGLKATIVLAEPFKSDVIAIQTLGRTRDNNTYYIEIVDRSFYYINKYYYSKKPIFKKYALSCTEINIDENELDCRCNKIIQDNNKLIYPIKRI